MRAAGWAGRFASGPGFVEVKGPWFDYLLVSPGEMKAILAGTGWRLRQILRSSGGQVYVAVIGKSRVSTRRR